MPDAPDQLNHDIDRATRIIGGLTDPHSRRVLRAYIAELESRRVRSRERNRDTV